MNMFIKKWVRNFQKSDYHSEGYDRDDMMNAFRAGFKASCRMVSKNVENEEINEKLKTIARDVIAMHSYQKITSELLNFMELEMEELAGDWVVQIKLYNPMKDNKLYVEFHGIENGMIVDFIL